jgi:hypothetical protein
MTTGSRASGAEAPGDEGRRALGGVDAVLDGGELSAPTSIEAASYQERKRRRHSNGPDILGISAIADPDASRSSSELRPQVSFWSAAVF